MENLMLLKRKTFCIVFSLLIFAGLTGLVVPANAQIFGQNKVRYKNIKFKVLQTPHFEIYSYVKNDSLIKRFAQESEIWYDLHQQVFRDTFKKRNPIILYENHSDFQQTTALEGEISVGTGGVTEGLKNRVIMPIMELNQQTRHVLGHELVHAFQYHSLIDRDSTSLENLNNIPLWMIEGMAEYLSIGKTDTYTAMWMRDAYLNKDIPTLRDLTNSNKYFPYRYGEAFWAYIGSTYGDTIIVPYFKAAAKYGFEMATRRTFGYDEQTLSTLWKNSIETAYKPYLKDTAQVPIGTRIVDEKNGGETYNVAPSVSPDGKYVAYMSEKDLLSIDLYLADAQTGATIRKLTSKTTNAHLDELSFIESAGAWSPDSRRFATGAFSKGRTQLFIIDINTGRTIETQGMGEVGQFSNLAWSPNGEDIAFSGLKNGQSDLYIYNIRTKRLTQLTNDRFSDYQANFSSDGSKIVFSSDRTTYGGPDKRSAITFNLAILDVASKVVTDIPVFNGANNLNPQFSANNQQIYFLSNRDGFRNLYRYTINSGKMEQLTDYFTGISGITEYSPALSLSRADDVVYSYYRAQKYSIYNAKSTAFVPKEVNPDAVNFDAGTLPPPVSVGVDLINANLNNFERFELIPQDSIRSVAYRPKFKLDAISSNGVGASVGQFGAGLQSGIQGIFSDILGRNQIFVNANVNGQIYDFGGQAAYVNQQSRISWGVTGSHIPYVSAFQTASIDNVSGVGQTYNEKYDELRTFVDQFAVFGSYPFSRVARVESAVGTSRYSYRIDRYNNYYQYDPFSNSIGYGIGTTHERLSKEEAAATYGATFNAFSIYQANVAFVGDNSYFGATAPLSGYRYRFGMEEYGGDYQFGALTADARKYLRVKPLTFAARVMTYARLGRDQERLNPLFIGYPQYIRGYEANSFYKNNTTVSPGGFDINQLQGSKMAIANFEIRLPFTGPPRLAAIESKFLISDINAFFYIGVAYDKDSKIAFRSEPRALGTRQNPQTGATETLYERIPAMSAGVSLRVNVFGYLILEPYYAFPFQRKEISGGVFGLTVAPGW
jgi:hypothetical protein